MIRRAWIARLFTATAVLVTGAGTAGAGLLPVSVTVQPEAGNFRWTYSVVLPSDMQLQSGSYFTIYDFAGYQSGTGTVTATAPDDTSSQNWALSTTLLGPTPDRLNPQDDPAIANLTFTYTGPTVPSGQLTLGNFAATSLFGATASSFFTATNPQAVSGNIDSNITNTLSPTGSEVPPPIPTPEPPPAIGTPEPATLVLAGLGLPLVGLGRYLRRKTAPAVA